MFMDFPTNLCDWRTSLSSLASIILSFNMLFMLLFQTGKPLMFRSEPPQTRRKQQDADKKQDKEEEELKYFFT